jgi:hypothetical protein
MQRVQRRFRGAMIAFMIVTMLSVNGCAWFQRSMQQQPQQVAYMAYVFAATYFITMNRALVNRPVTAEDVVVYRLLHGYRALQLVTNILLIQLIVDHFNLHRTLWWQMSIYALFLRGIPGNDRGLRDHHQSDRR